MNNKNCLEKNIREIKRVKENFNFEKQRLTFIHQEKEYSEQKIITDWFAVNQTDKVTWLVYREINKMDRYRQIKLENIKGIQIITLP